MSASIVQKLPSGIIRSEQKTTFFSPFILISTRFTSNFTVISFELTDSGIGIYTNSYNIYQKILSNFENSNYKISFIDQNFTQLFLCEANHIYFLNNI